VGFSFGGLGAYVAASRDTRWAALVLIAAPLGTMEAARIYLDEQGIPGKWLDGLVRRALIRTFGVEPESFDAARNLGSIRVPVLIVHGENDEVVPAWHAERLEAAIPAGLATVVRVPGASHSAVLDDESVGAGVAGFLHEQLEKAGARA
jgi:pimeloyl-ACP methyl ester carboxylesterase